MTLPGDEVFFQDLTVNYAPPKDEFDIHYIEKILQNSKEILFIKDQQIEIFRMLDEHIKVIHAMSVAIKTLDEAIGALDRRLDQMQGYDD
jgi:hypothetical protein